MEQYLRQGLAPDSKVLDIRQVDVSTGRFLEDNMPVYVITFTTQEVLMFRDRKTREVVVGAENRVEQCNYAAVITRVEEELENELTGGWKVIEVRGFFFLYLMSGRGLMTRDRWHVGRGVHIYNLACSLRSHSNHSAFWDVTSITDVAMGFALKIYICPRITRCFVDGTHDIPTFYSHHHSRNMYTHILINPYYRVRHLQR
jgi:Tim44-like domain